jgi:uncharacterized membrane protein YheB (UPF0754 family)
MESILYNKKPQLLHLYVREQRRENTQRPILKNISIVSTKKINLFCKHSQNQCITHSLKDFVQQIEVDFFNRVINKLWDMYQEKSNMEH